MGGTGGIDRLLGVDVPKPPSPGLTKKEIEELGKQPGIAGVAARGGILPKVPEPPGEDADIMLARQRALIERTIAAAFTGTGRKATIATSPRGVTTPAPTRRRTLTPTERTVRRRTVT
jgi:hypothetical protein